VLGFEPMTYGSESECATHYTKRLTKSEHSEYLDCINKYMFVTSAIFKPVGLHTLDMIFHISATSQSHTAHPISLTYLWLYCPRQAT